MSIETSEASERTLALERKMYRLRAALDAMVIWRVPTLEQGLAMAWARGPRRQSQVIGEVDGCASAGFPGAEVLVKNTAGKRLGSATAKSDGKYKVWCNLDSDPQDVDIVATPVGTYAARFAGPVVTPATLSVGANPVPPIVIPPTADWCCGEVDYFPGDCCVADADHQCLCDCANPIPNVYYIGDDAGTHTLTYGVGGLTAWTSPEFTVSGQSLYVNGGPPNRICELAGTGNARAFYELRLDCTKWTLRLFVLVVNCRPSTLEGLIVKYGYDTGIPDTSFSPVFSDDAPFDCDNIDLINFVLPTYLPDIAAPGGGGALAAVS